VIAKTLRRLGIIGAACFAYGALVEVRDFRVRRVTLDILPPGSPSLRVLHLSDLHLLARQSAKLRFVEQLAGLEPDLVINTGDNIAEPEALQPLLESLGRLRQVPGVFVFGSNDYAGPHLANPLGYLRRSSGHNGVTPSRTPLPTQALREGLTGQGWRDLNGHRTALEVCGLNLEFRGTEDAHHGLDDYESVAGPASANADLSIGVTHSPYRRVLDAMTTDKVQLILAGHTHGGQVCVPGYGALTTNCDLPPAQAKGLSPYQGSTGSSWLHVSGGVGTSPYAPYRFACPPEVTLLTLRAAPSR
jgi:uncharacterized protein